MYNRVCVLSVTWISFLPGLIMSGGERRVGPSKTVHTLTSKVLIGFLFPDSFLFIVLTRHFGSVFAELGWDALSIQVAPHDPGTSLQ